jgi:hypothetical protein
VHEPKSSGQSKDRINKESANILFASYRLPMQLNVPTFYRTIYALIRFDEEFS